MDMDGAVALKDQDRLREHSSTVETPAADGPNGSPTAEDQILTKITPYNTSQTAAKHNLKPKNHGRASSCGQVQNDENHQDINEESHTEYEYESASESDGDWDDEDPRDAASELHEDSQDKNHEPAKKKIESTAKTQPKWRPKVAKTAHEKAEKLNKTSCEEMKQHIRSELRKKRRAAVDDSDIEPPKAKRVRRTKRKAGQHSREDDDDDRGGIPNADQAFITQKARDSGLVGRVNRGTNNRRSETQGRDLKAATSVFGRGNVSCYDGGLYYLKGMKSTTRLKEVQLPVVAWMNLREHGLAPPCGGILCDDTGMGKTLMTLALIVGNPPSPGHLQEWSGATLIIVPSQQLLTQWRQEFCKHVESIKDSDIYAFTTAGFRSSGGGLSRYKVVLTTIAELQKYPKDKQLEELREMHEEGSDAYRSALKDIAGELYGVKWYRIVLDEGHAVKNKNTLSFKACYGLEKRSFWGLTATPIINSQQEMFPYLKLLRIEGIETVEDFKEKYLDCSDAKDKMTALTHLITYRRTKKDHFLGRPVLKSLPDFETKEVWVKLGRHERLLYELVAEFYKSLKPPDTMRRVQRQRMLISHPWNIEKALRGDFEPEALTLLRKLSIKLDNGATIEKVLEDHEKSKPQVLAEEEENKKSRSKSKIRKLEHEGRDKSKLERSKDFHPRLTDNNLCMTSLLQYTINELMVDGDHCGICGTDMIQKPRQIRGCDHMFCVECLYDYENNQTGKCPNAHCQKPYDKSQVDAVQSIAVKEVACIEANRTEALKQAASRPTKATGKQGGRAKRQQGKPGKVTADQKAKAEKEFNKKEYGGDANGIFLDLDKNDAAFIRIGTHELKGVGVLSSKISCARDIVSEWQQRFPEDKIIIFHEFIKTGKMLGMALNELDIPFVYFNGSISHSARAKALERLQTDPTVKVLVTSRVGGEGLNLTCANRLIVLDHWWNNAAELQAFGRIHRMGQMKRTYAVVIKAHNTIDDNIADLQESKADEVAHRLQDDAHETKLMSDWEIMMHTAPKTYKSFVRRLLREIQEEDAADAEMSAPVTHPETPKQGETGDGD